MKKWLILGLFIIFPFNAKAFYAGFLDGKFYDSGSGTFAFSCFMDNNCYNNNGVFMGTKTSLLGADAGPVPQVAGAETSTPILPTQCPTGSILDSNNNCVFPSVVTTSTPTAVTPTTPQPAEQTIPTPTVTPPYVTNIYTLPLPLSNPYGGLVINADLKPQVLGRLEYSLNSDMGNSTIQMRFDSAGNNISDNVGIDGARYGFRSTDGLQFNTTYYFRIKCYQIFPGFQPVFLGDSDIYTFTLY